ncbi:glycosyltransferase family 4 protein [Pseudodesulfovibrio piezophilus]|uniref:Putative glycosyltransferase protein n=1 Tax=Pseudodesulfovibrio piezophilus (strain DSM 21447 / JCM 15486 / C1TLV30) TaxID=1322246 RepID=M1WUH0_PSEP2|nr:glycosyltransferase family 4 protein [Pseudodesulfovibrio piezophilus]CCH47323.1 putative glycosyltransferase protein [Pseudodesulfovibrio piezophilus C1TLV30]
MADKQKILIVGPRGIFGYEGGIEKFSDQFIYRAAHILEIDVLTLHPFKGKRLKGLKTISVMPTHALKTDKLNYIISSIKQHLKKKYDHIFILGTNFSILIPFFKVIFWKKVKIHLRSGSVDHTLKKWPPAIRLAMQLTERFCNYADTVISVSPSIQRHLASIGVHSHLIRNGLDKSHKMPLATRKKCKVVCVGRITAQKNYSVLINAARLIDDTNIKIDILGGADLSDEMHHLTQLMTSAIKPKIQFHGGVSRQMVYHHLSTASLYINCSVHEGMSNAILEAIQAGTPLLLSDIEANRDLQLPDFHYFDPHSPEDLILKIQDALSYMEKYIVPLDRFDDWDQTVDSIIHVTGMV